MQKNSRIICWFLGPSKPIFAHEVMKMSPSSMRYATLMEPAQFLIIKAEALTKSLGPQWFLLDKKRAWEFWRTPKSREKAAGSEILKWVDFVVMKHGHNMSQFNEFYAVGDL